MTRRLAGAVASLLAMLAGLWLILAPFALGSQPKDTDWKDETFTNVWSGIGLGALGLIGVITFATALIRHLGARDMIAPRRARSQAASAASADAAPTAAAAPDSTASASKDWDELIAPLVEALTTDLDRDHAATSETDGSSQASKPVETTNNSTRQPAPAGDH